MRSTAHILPFPSRNNRGCRSRRLLPPLPAQTDDLSSLIIPGSTLAICDAENLIFSARDHGCEVNFNALGQLLSPANTTTELHAAFSRPPSDDSFTTMFEAAGWRAHARDIIWVPGPQGLAKRANADTLFAALVGLLVAAYRPASLILLTGDGDLACDTAQAILSLVPNPPLISTLAIPGTASSRLDPARNPLFHARIALGKDMLLDKVVTSSANSPNQTRVRFNPMARKMVSHNPPHTQTHAGEASIKDFHHPPKDASLKTGGWGMFYRRLFSFIAPPKGLRP